MVLPPYHLFVSYNNEGAPIRQKLARLALEELGPGAEQSIRQAAMTELDPGQLPPGTGEVFVHPVFMQSGYAAEELLPARLKEAYAQRGEEPLLRLLPVWGATPALAQQTLPLLLPWLGTGESGVLVVAHGRKGGKAAPEPGFYADSLARLLPEVEVQLAYFGVEPGAEQAVAAMAPGHVIVLPFLAGRGMHYRDDMPSAACAARSGKRMTLLPPLGDLLC